MADVDVHEPVEHVARSAGVVERDHVRGVVEEDVGEVSGTLVDAGGLAFEYPVFARGPGAGGVELEAGAAVEGHAVDQFLGADVVADEVPVTGEEQDREVREEVREQVDGGGRVRCAEGGRDGTGAFGPAGLLVGVDVEGFEHVFAAEVRVHVDEVRRPGHPAGREIVGETDVVHVHAGLQARRAGFGVFDNFLEDMLALGDVNVAALLRDGFEADVNLLCDQVRGWAVGFDEALFVGEGEIGEIM